MLPNDHPRVNLPAGGLKKLKKESFCTVLVTVRVLPCDLCFCFFLMVFSVMFLPSFQSILQPYRQQKGRSDQQMLAEAAKTA